MYELTDADGYTVSDATLGQIVTDDRDVTDDVELNYWDKAGERLYVNEWVSKLEEHNMYVDLEAETAHCDHDSWEDKLSVDVDGTEIEIVCEDTNKTHSLTIVAEGVEAESRECEHCDDEEPAPEADGGQELVADGGEPCEHSTDDYVCGESALYQIVEGGVEGRYRVEVAAVIRAGNDPHDNEGWLSEESVGHLGTHVPREDVDAVDVSDGDVIRWDVGHEDGSPAEADVNIEDDGRVRLESDGLLVPETLPDPLVLKCNIALGYAITGDQDDDAEPTRLNQPEDDDWNVEIADSGHEIKPNRASRTLRSDAVDHGITYHNMDGDEFAIELAQAVESAGRAARSIRIEGDYVSVQLAGADNDPTETPVPVPDALHDAIVARGYDPAYEDDPTADDYQYNSALYSR